MTSVRIDVDERARFLTSERRGSIDDSHALDRELP
jgi:hypothetical protein